MHATNNSNIDAVEEKEETNDAEDKEEFADDNRTVESEGGDGDASANEAKEVICQIRSFFVTCAHIWIYFIVHWSAGNFIRSIT